MEISNWTKLAVVVIVCIAAIILGYAGKLDSQAVVALLSASLGYVFGNAHGVISAVQSLNKGDGASEKAPSQNPIQEEK
ncbi:MAG: hypothetical protein QMD88_00040 [Coprothermobacterota bacterium]|nr:hypothetical protein [Coprothermobacterota bacterium]